MPLASLLIPAPAFIACAQDGNHCGQVRYPPIPPTGAQVVGHGREVLALVELGPVTPRGAPGWRLRRSRPRWRWVGRGPAGTARPPEPEVSVRRPAQRPSRSDRG